MADSKILIDLEPGIREIRKEADGLENLFVDMRKSVSVTVKALEKGFRGLTASGRALNNTLYNLFGTAERSLASFDELDRLGKKESGGAAEGGSTVSVTVEGVSVAVDAGRIVQQIQQTVSSTAGPMIDVDLAVDASSVTESVNDLALTLETSFDNLLNLDFSPLIGGLVNVMGAAGLLAGLLASGLGAVLGDLLSPDFSPVINTLLTATAATAAWNVICTAASAVTTAFGAAVAFLTSPIGIVLLAIGALIAIVVLLVTHWEEVKAAVISCWDKIVEVWGVVSQWFNENVVEPIAAFFSGLWETISNAAGSAWDAICEIWTAVSEWFDLNVIQPVATFFTGLWDGIGGAASSVWDGICRVWETVSNWFDLNVIRPVTTFFSNLWDGIGSAASSVWDTICGAWTAAAEWFDLNVVQPVATFFSGLWENIGSAASGAWDGIKETFQAVAAWFDEHVISPVAGGFKDFINGLIGGVESFANFFIRGINSIIRGINSISFKLPDFLGGAQIGFHIPQISELKLPRLAMGAVIPPNREFMAVLGDQRHGNNIEAPEGLLRQIAREEAGSYEIVAELREILGAIREGKVLMVGEQTLATVVSRAMTNQSRARGAAVIPV